MVIHFQTVFKTKIFIYYRSIGNLDNQSLLITTYYLNYYQMGNTNCIASGGAPHRADITITNNTKYELILNVEENCGRECDHNGWQILEGKIIEGHEPPKKISAYSNGRFSVSGREGTAVAPKGKVFYVNIEENLKVIFEWNASGWTSPMSSSTASINITGISPKSGMFKNPTPWNQKLTGESDPNSWIYNLRPEEGTVKESMKTAKDLANIKVKF